jgi:hypothetical protein
LSGVTRRRKLLGYTSESDFPIICERKVRQTRSNTFVESTFPLFSGLAAMYF